MPRVLLVDDDAAGLELRALILARHGYECVCAAERVRAMQLLIETKPDVVVLDLRLPELEDGLELIRAIHGTNAGTPVIVLCGWPEDLAGQPESAMVRTILAKPVRPEKLIAAIAASLQ